MLSGKSQPAHYSESSEFIVIITITRWLEAIYKWKRKDLEKWLKEHPGYVEDLGAFIPVGDTL